MLTYIIAYRICLSLNIDPYNKMSNEKFASIPFGI